MNGLDGAAAVLTNGRGEGEGEANHDASEENTPPSTNGPIEAPDSTVTMTSLGYSETEPRQVLNVGTDEEEGTLVMRAERIIITDEGDDGPDNPPPQGEVEELEDATQVSSETPKEGGETVVEEEVKAEIVPETSTELEEEKESDKSISPMTKTDTATGEGGMGGDVKTNEDVDEEIKADEGEKSEAAASEQLQSPDNAADGATVASVPVYSEAQPSALSPRPEAEGEVEAGEVPVEADQSEGEAVIALGDQAPEGAEVALEAKVPDTLPGQFQEVPLADPQENQGVQRTAGGPGEHEPLLSQPKAPQAEPPAAIVPTITTETHTPTRAAQGGEVVAPKRKTCQCCSVM